MAMDGINITEDTEMADCEADKVVTMVDVLQEQQDFEEDANAVLGASDANNCTYSQGYIKRQAIYACLTCCPESKTDPDKRAGVCLACSLNCHENHDLVELYTKRNFRCDCGNPKFNSNPCQFITNKDDLNTNNMYNHNFSGLYCTCKRPYPDPEATVDEDMIQCIICEDWLHASHLNAVIPPSDQYSEMICKGCMDRNEFLHDYSSLAVNNGSIEVDVITVNGDKNPVLCNGDATNEAEINSESDMNSGILNGVDVDVVENNSHPNEEIDNVPALKENSIENIEQDAEMEADSLKETTVLNTLEKTTDNESEDKITNTEATSKTTEAPIQAAIEEQKETIDKTDDKLLESQLELKDTKQEDKTEVTLDNDADTTKTGNVTGEAEELKTNEEMLNNDAKTDSENSIGVTESTKENVDKDSADAVMDAINELLDDPKDTNNKNKDNSEQACEESSKNKDDTNSTNVPETEIQIAIDNENLSTDTEMTDNKSIEEQVDTDSDKKDSISTADGSAETDKKMSDSKINKQLETPNESENSAPASDDNYKLNSDVEMINNKSAESDALNASEKTDPIKNADDNNTTITDTETTNNVDNNEQLDTTVNFEKKEGTGMDLVDESGVTDGNNKTSDINDTKEETDSTNEHKRKLSTDMPEETCKKAKLDIDKCTRPKGVKKVFKGATFWPPNFRQLLCTCGECISMYKDLQVLFLTDLEDTVSYYESLGKQKLDAGASQYERGLEALSSLDRMQQINALTEYNNMRDRLLDFLTRFKDRQEVVKEEDIRAFFADMKPRREPDGVYFCR